MDKEIILHFERTHFEDIYFKDDQGDYIKDPRIKNKFWVLLIYSISFPLTILFYGSSYSKEIYILFLILLAILGYDYYTQFVVLKKWKQKILIYLNDLESYTSHKIILSNQYFSIIQDTEEVIEKWSNFTKVEIKEDYMLLISEKENYFFPNKSMSSSDYNIFRAFVCDNIKQSQ